MIKIIEKDKIENFQNEYKTIRRVVPTTISHLINQRVLIDKNCNEKFFSRKEKKNEEKAFLKIELKKD